jgi:hypothetical protein
MSAKARHRISAVLLILASVVAVVAVLGAWANRQLLDTDQWVDTSTSLMQEPTVQAATAAYLSDQLINGTTVRDQLEQALPKRLDALAGPLAAGSGELADRTAKRLITSGAFQKLWRETNRKTHEQFRRVVVDNETLLPNAGVVLDLRPQLGVLAQRLGVSADTSGNKGRIRVLYGDELKTVRDAVDVLQTVRWVSVLVLLVLLVAAVWIAPEKPGAILGVGVALVVAGLLVLTVRRLGGQYVINKSVDAGGNQEVAQEVWRIATGLLRSIAGAGVVVGVLFVLAGWVAGGTRWALATRRFLAPALADHVGLVLGAVAIVLFALLAAGLLPAAGSLWAVVLYAVLAGAGVLALRRQVEHEAP